MMLLLFKAFGAMHVAVYRLSGGMIGGRMGSSDILLLTTTGRKSGKTRTRPLTYLREGESYVVAASAGGDARHPGWYWNAARGTHPVQIQVRRELIAVDVRETEGEERSALYRRFIDVNEQYATYEDRTARTIPVLVLTPRAAGETHSNPRLFRQRCREKGETPVALITRACKARGNGRNTSLVKAG